MKTLVVGLGNPLLGDDGIGWHIAREVQRRVTAPDVEVDCHAGGGLSLMERLVGYERAIIIDAITTGQAPAGHVSCCRLEELPNPGAGHFSSSHDTTLRTAVEFGRKAGLSLPAAIFVVAVEAQHVYNFGEELSPEVAAAAPEAVQRVLGVLDMPE